MNHFPNFYISGPLKKPSYQPLLHQASIRQKETEIGHLSPFPSITPLKNHTFLARYPAPSFLDFLQFVSYLFLLSPENNFQNMPW